MLASYKHARLNKKKYELLDDLSIQERLQNANKSSKLSYNWGKLLQISCINQQTLRIIELIHEIITNQRFKLIPSGCSWNLYAPQLERQPPDPFNLPDGIRSIQEILNSKLINTLTPTKILEAIALKSMGRDKSRIFPKRKTNTIYFYRMIILLYQFIYQKTDLESRKHLSPIPCSKKNLPLPQEEAQSFNKLETLLHCDISPQLPRCSP